MKKTFLLTDAKKNPQRVLDSIKHNIRKYIKREKRKPLPEGSNFWKINCKFGQTQESAVEIRFEDMMKNINEASQLNLDSFYIELISEAGTMNFKKIESIKNEDKEKVQDETKLDDVEIVEEETEFET